MDLLENIFSYENHSTVCGLTDELSILYYYTYFKTHQENVLIVTNALFDATKITQKLKTYTEDVCLFPMDDFLSSVALAISPDLKVQRLETLERIRTEKKCIIVTNLMGYLRFLPSIEESNHLKLTISKSSTFSRDQFLETLDQFGYRRETLVTSTGEYAVRGFIIDIFPIEANHPIRIETFGDEIENIRVFDENTQMSIEEVNEYTFLPFKEVETDQYNSLYDYLYHPLVFFVDQAQIKNGYDKIQKDIYDYNLEKEIDKVYMYQLDEIKVQNNIKIETINNIPNAVTFKCHEIMNFKGDYHKLADFCQLHKNNHTLVICLSKDKQVERIEEILSPLHYGNPEKGKITVMKKKINAGFMINDYIFISEYDMEDIKVISSYKTTFKMGQKIKSFDDIKVGDYVVHTNHGIGIYGGIEAISNKGLMRDYIVIQYLDNDKVYIPASKISTIYKYSDADGTKPKINKLNSTNWAKTKMRVRSKIKDISDELIKLYAKRSSIKGESYSDYEEEEIFGVHFEYTETSDQLKCIKEINQDLKSSIPMDRLLCGDVGFGKTEVAFRAMFKTVINGFQVAYLCPTTLLSRQQYKNALERFKDFPIEIALLNRFVSVKEVKRIIEGLKKGSIDIVIGTHKLLNDAIEYKNLGLLVIDEEQRFGVTHKEKIKKLKSDINVLTLSATPIPRTLKMAMSGLRDLSIIDTPPVNRYPVQTYVLEENDVIIKDAIYKELSRNGQVYILYNRVESIMDMHTRIQTLIPEARIEIAHGKMEKNELEHVVTAFVEGAYDILICTTIIETGIDIPNVNTLLVFDADRFGLSQLYQLRGRVGRSDRIAYAYLMYQPHKMLNDIAIKRLQSIKDFTELGSGYKIAMRDLAIRGAGDFLGSEQAGFVEAVGLDLYTKMVNEEISRQNGEEILDEEMSTPLIEVSNHIDDDYVSEENLKIEIHKLINSIEDEETLLKVKTEIEDRFGKISEEMEIYMYEEWFEKLADKLKIKQVNYQRNSIEIILPEEISNQISGDKLFLVMMSIHPKYRICYKMKQIHIELPLLSLEKHFIYYEVRLLQEIVNLVSLAS